ncbi:leucyl aminopeptidase [Oharaeibacter diazotrophicus]|uniref:Probable cytosol aminopeptidase n=1 Tax=Oharaeibacter diazotrophicus TaxID=1920512 RepID=A0A4R6RJL2_9HYPH|nr:leucyl aminopeptidase [Oharaeibacter diazotrophicus]TDP86759.1 leucyl aminopeptidase [Oharaeibacter diazotrophicus]BBE71298.1 cytosol aminopeptidase [Pleomorphomonas sp. SM30]GLS78053.1 putative cytosol aminopeptidase [Oharaeibacter diazotrophicus]
MAPLPSITVAKPAQATSGVVVLLADESGAFGPSGAALLEAAPGIARAVAATDYKGKAQGFLDVVAPTGLEVDRVVLAGVGPLADLSAEGMLKLGGAVMGKLREMKARQVSVVLERSDGAAFDPALVAEFALGLRLRAYDWDKHKTRKKDEPAPAPKIVLHVDDHAKAKKAWADLAEVAAGVELARDLVNEAPNVLGPVEFAEEAQRLESVGVEVEILTDKDMRKLGMGALLGVAQGSARPARLAILRWNGGKAKEQPIAFVGKGVVFDTGGISIKPGQGMEDMKGDMGGAAAVIGTIRALAGRKARVNAIGILGLVENMPDGNAYRPGDILKSMSGQTIEIINTDAEGRLVLADALWYCQDRFKPAFMVDLATLTGACMVALGTQHAGLFSNDDGLADKLTAAGKASGEKLWRLPLGPEYDKQIDSRFADMKNTGGRYGGAITAAQFLKRFVADTPWAHLDVAGTAMASPDSDINRSWGSGFGVRLLDRLVRDNFES